MKLRVRIHRQTSRMELPGEEPSLTELIDHIKEVVLPPHGLSAETQFSLSLNGSELLTDAGQTLSSCGIVSGDLICVVLPQPAAPAPSNSPAPSDSPAPSNPTNSSTENHQTLQTTAMTSAQSVSSPAALTGSEEITETLDSGPSVCSWEPMLCSEAEEGQAPLSLELLYSSAQPTSPSDAVVVAVHLLMLESGFVPQGCEMRPGEMPAGWRSAGGVYRLQYSHPLCGNSLAMVPAVCMGPVVVVNASLKVNQTVNTVCKVCLNPSHYVTDEWPGGSAAAAFRDLKELSRTVKDQLVYPLISAARAAMSLPVVFGLAALPPELLLRVLRLLDVVSVVRLSSVCRHFHVATADPMLWRHLYRRDFTDPDPSRPRDTDWKELYKCSFQIRLEMRRKARHRSLPPYPRDIFIPAPLFPPLPGIIGGEYDTRPNIPRGPHLPHWTVPRPLRDSSRPARGRPADVRRGFI